MSADPRVERLRQAILSVEADSFRKNAFAALDSLAADHDRQVMALDRITLSRDRHAAAIARAALRADRQERGA